MSFFSIVGCGNSIIYCLMSKQLLRTFFTIYLKTLNLIFFFNEFHTKNSV